MWSPLKKFSKFGFEGKTFEDVKVFEIVDGDTLKCFVDLGGESVFGRRVWLTVRLADIDAPELKGETVPEKVCATVALLTLAEMICCPPGLSTICGFKDEELTLLSSYVKDVKNIYGGFNDSYEITVDETFSKEIVELNKKYKDLVSKFLKDNFDRLHSFTLKTDCMDLYGRVVGKLYSKRDLESINLELCTKGVVRYYKGNKCREKWCLEDLSKIILKTF
jgi:endonuclease YncB( thermonuclease family)